MDDNPKNFLQGKLQESSNLTEMLNRVQIIAQNSTRAKHEIATVSLSKDWDGFFWVAKTPKGASIMHGGIINHGRVGEPDWSIHT